MEIKVVETSKLALTTAATRGKYQDIIEACMALQEGKSIVFKPTLAADEKVKDYRSKLSYKLSHVTVKPHTILSVRVTTGDEIAVSLVKGEHRKKGEKPPAVKAPRKAPATAPAK